MNSLTFASQDGPNAALSHQFVNLMDAVLTTLESSDSYRVLGAAFNGLILNTTVREGFNQAVAAAIESEPSPTPLPANHTIYLRIFFYVFFAVAMALALFSLAYCVGGVYGIASTMPFLEVDAVSTPF